MRKLRSNSEDKNMRYTSNFLRGLLIASLAGLPIAAQALDNEQYGGVPDNVRSWFKSVRSPHGVPCCDISDGHRTAYDMRSDNHYWVPIEGEWRQVPSEAIVYNAGNPVGEAVVWYVRQGPDAVYIRCFVPGGGV
jgi:hypothetical protein